MRGHFDMKLPLYYPISYLRATEEEKKLVCNGCGAKDGFKVPNTFWGLLIVLACEIHDWMFYKGATLGDYFFANVIFFWNLTAIIFNKSNKFMLLLRMERALKYFLGVMFKSGQNAFWVDKQRNNIMTITIKGKFQNE